MFDPEEAMAEGVPQLHGTDDPFVRDPVHNILLEIHSHIGDVDAGFADADVIHEGTYSSPRVQHAHLETHGSIAWMEDGRLNVRTSSQSPPQQHHVGHPRRRFRQHNLLNGQLGRSTGHMRMHCSPA
ncbi:MULTISPECIES: molybdopterin cofactor-binding domain-containing protein [unclassified Kitasatospora]|uniref:molybdopterin cofactor-binding domain-containing protein n=1 Tax=unclassified Kitasatospora TaxID=2633591 RepID=UPI0033C420F7